MIGDRNDAIELSTTEKYNPKINQWSSVVAMNSRRNGVRFITKKMNKIVFSFLSCVSWLYYC